jgi:hypothetical protein
MWIHFIHLIEGMTREKQQSMVAFIKHYAPQFGTDFGAVLPSIWRTNEKLARKTGITPRWIDCCINSCIAYTGSFANDTKCTQKLKHNGQICNEPRYYPQKDKDGSHKARKRYLFIPLLDRLRQQFSSQQAEILSTYRASFDSSTGSELLDVFSGDLYQDYHRRTLGLFSR